MSYGYLEHHGIKGQKWGVRRYQNADGSLTSAGRQRYGMVRDKNSYYIGGKQGHIDAYRKDRKALLKEMKTDIKEDETLTRKEKRSYYKNSKKIIDDFLDEKYDLKVSEMSKSDSSAYATKLAIAAIIDIPLYNMKGGLWVPVKISTNSSKRLYKEEKNKDTGVSTLYDRKGRVVATSEKKSKSKSAYKKVSKAVDDKESLKAFNPKDQKTRDKIWKTNEINSARNARDVYDANKNIMDQYNKEREKRKQRIKETYFNV